jgi:hypothetical protein
MCYDVGNMDNIVVVGIGGGIGGYCLGRRQILGVGRAMMWFLACLVVLAALRGVALLMAAAAEAIAWGVGWIVKRVRNAL